ncbi:hypothetical protein Drorol1_Dr00026367 [Drosera rotundifolia]
MDYCIGVGQVLLQNITLTQFPFFSPIITSPTKQSHIVLELHIAHLLLSSIKSPVSLITPPEIKISILTSPLRKIPIPKMPLKNFFPDSIWPSTTNKSKSSPRHDHHDTESDDVEPTDEVLNETTTNTMRLISKDPLFEKPLTPSDVGKLNRLVIPKQHAEKHFPLSNNQNNDGGVDDTKGTVLSFEDESGKCLMFLYSYWNSSQSYVFTKGWSRFVKEKRRDAGDVVVFDRERGYEGRLFIGWRRRGVGIGTRVALAGFAVGQRMVNGGGGRGWYGAGAATAAAWHAPLGIGLPYQQQPHYLHATAGSVTHGQRTPTSSTTTPASGNSKTLRLFGVDLECQLDEPSPDPQSSDGSPMSYAQGSAFHYFDYIANYPQANHRDQMDINFQMGSRLG